MCALCRVALQSRQTCRCCVPRTCRVDQCQEVRWRWWVASVCVPHGYVIWDCPPTCGIWWAVWLAEKAKKTTIIQNVPCLRAKAVRFNSFRSCTFGPPEYSELSLWWYRWAILSWWELITRVEERSVCAVGFKVGKEVSAQIEQLSEGVCAVVRESVSELRGAAEGSAFPRKKWTLSESLTFPIFRS